MTNKLEVKAAGKKFHRQWIFRNLSFSLSSGESMLLAGPNGSGKSTLMRILAGQMAPTEGSVELLSGSSGDLKPAPVESWYRKVCWAGPYFDLYPDLTLQEQVNLHFRFRDCLLPAASHVPEALRLADHAQKTLRHFSSGMLHRVKMGLAILSAGDLLLLDEATANLDAANSAFLFELIEQHRNGRMLIFASNAENEFRRFEKQIRLS